MIIHPIKIQDNTNTIIYKLNNIKDIIDMYINDYNFYTKNKSLFHYISYVTINIKIIYMDLNILYNENKIQPMSESDKMALYTFINNNKIFMDKLYNDNIIIFNDYTALFDLNTYIQISEEIKKFIDKL